MEYRGYEIEAEYIGFAWWDPNADNPLSIWNISESACKKQIDEHIELGSESHYFTELNKED